MLVFFLTKLVLKKNLLPVREMQQRLEVSNLHASHELKTPLTSIALSLDLALKTSDFEHIKKAKKTILGLSRDIDNMLALTHIDTGDLRIESVN